MLIHISRTTRILISAVAALALFASGFIAGQNKFGQPKTIIHMVILKWNPGVSDTDKQGALEGVKDMAAKIPGVKNVWIKAERLQPRDFSAAFAIEFQNRAAADAYAESPIHQAWEQKYTLLAKPASPSRSQIHSYAQPKAADERKAACIFSSWSEAKSSIPRSAAVLGSAKRAVTSTPRWFSSTVVPWAKSE